jgi:hypothetical protein
VPETITSVRRPQFISSLCLQLCEMLNISHKQTTAYHPELNGAVERLHRHLKDALRARAAAATWSEELPFVLLRLQTQPREDTGLSRLRQFSVPKLCCQTNFCKMMSFQLILLSIFYSETLHVPASSLPRHNSSTDLPSKLPAELLSAPLIWVHRGGVIPPLQLLYDGPSAVLRHGPCSFTIRGGSRDEVVTVSRLKACTAADATPGSPRCRGRLPGSRPGGLAATKWVSFSDLLVSSPSSSPAPPRGGPGTVFLPG